MINKALMLAQDITILFDENTPAIYIVSFLQFLIISLSLTPILSYKTTHTLSFL